MLWNRKKLSDRKADIKAGRATLKCWAYTADARVPCAMGSRICWMPLLTVACFTGHWLWAGTMGIVHVPKAEGQIPWNCPQRGSWCMMHGSLFMVHGSWCMVNDESKAHRQLLSGWNVFPCIHLFAVILVIQLTLFCFGWWFFFALGAIYQW